MEHKPGHVVCSCSLECPPNSMSEGMEGVRICDRGGCESRCESGGDGDGV